MESALCCVTSAHPDSWSSHLPWVQYTHNSLTCSAVRVSPFEASIGYQPPLLQTQEWEVAVASRCRISFREWRMMQEALLRSQVAGQCSANRWRCSAPSHQVGQLLWLSSQKGGESLPCPTS